MGGLQQNIAEVAPRETIYKVRYQEGAGKHTATTAKQFFSLAGFQGSYRHGEV